MTAKGLVKRLVRATGYDLVPTATGAAPSPPPTELLPYDLETVAVAKPFTLTSRERMYSLIGAIRYLSRHQIEGAIVECGVWRGGSMLTAARTLASTGDTGRDLFLYDTFDGMSPPTKDDMDAGGNDAQHLLDTTSREGDVWAIAQLDVVKKTMSISGYAPERIHYVKGRVEDTIPDRIPDKIALLRLDTDWYESTRHELTHLFPRLVPGGVLIIDDYGHWQGARKAVDEYFSQNPIKILFNVIDYTGRIAVKAV